MQGMMRMMNSIPTMVNGMRENQAKAALAPIVKYVVGNTATPSPEMVNFAVIAGSAPVTQTEKNAYLDMMKKVARRTPEVIMQFLKLEKNGSYVLDEFGLDAHITKRAMQFSIASEAKKNRKNKEKEKERTQELERIRMMQDHELSLLQALGHGNNAADTVQGQNTLNTFTVQDPIVIASTPSPFDAGLFGYDIYGGGPVTDFFAPSHPVHVDAPAQHTPVSNAAQPEFISLLDILRNHNNNINQGSRSNFTVSNQMSPTPTVGQNMMMNGGMDFGFGF
jgi:hypothetical protein